MRLGLYAGWKKIMCWHIYFVFSQSSSMSDWERQNCHHCICLCCSSLQGKMIKVELYNGWTTTADCGLLAVSGWQVPDVRGDRLFAFSSFHCEAIPPFDKHQTLLGRPIRITGTRMWTSYPGQQSITRQETVGLEWTFCRVDIGL